MISPIDRMLAAFTSSKKRKADSMLPEDAERASKRHLQSANSTLQIASDGIQCSAISEAVPMDTDYYRPSAEAKQVSATPEPQSLLTYSITPSSQPRTIDDLPNEILVDIFTYCLPIFPDSTDQQHQPRPSSEQHASYDVKSAPWVFTHVCSRWRGLAISEQRFWAQFVIDIDAYPRRPFNGHHALLCEQLRRAWKAPLSIHITSRRRMEEHEVMTLLLPTVGRWERAHFDANGSFHDQVRRFQGKFEMLKSLHWSFERHNPSDLPFDAFSGTRTLEHVSLSNLGTEDMQIDLPWRQIHSLHMGYTTEMGEPHICAQIRQNATQVKECTTRYVPPRPQPQVVVRDDILRSSLARSEGRRTKRAPTSQYRPKSSHLKKTRRSWGFQWMSPSALVLPSLRPTTVSSCDIVCSSSTPVH